MDRQIIKVDINFVASATYTAQQETVKNLQVMIPTHFHDVTEENMKSDLVKNMLQTTLESLLTSV